MSLQANRDTAPEMRLRSSLHALGLRYRVHVRPLPELRRTADIHRSAAITDLSPMSAQWFETPSPFEVGPDYVAVTVPPGTKMASSVVSRRLMPRGASDTRFRMCVPAATARAPFVEHVPSW